MLEKKYNRVDLVLKNAKIFVDQQVVTGGIAIDEGRIVGINKEPNLSVGDEILDIQGQLVIPGLIDIHAHLRDLNFQAKEDFYTGTSSAAAGGITTVMDMPNTDPPTVSAKLIREKISLAEKKIIVNTGFYAGIPEALDELENMQKQGIFGYKLYLSHSLSQFNVEKSESINELLQRVKRIELPLLIHAERKHDIEEILNKTKEKKLRPQEIYLISHSEEVERKAIKYILELNASIKAQLHFCHLSTALGLNLLKDGKKVCNSITTEVTPHHLLLTEDSLMLHGAFSKMLPPLRKLKDQIALWRGLNTGDIDIIATDHAPHKLSEKNCEFSIASNGVPGFETILPLMLTAMHREKIKLPQLVQGMCENPAKFLHLSNKGRIATGFDADLTVINLKQQKKINATEFKSKAKYSPFDGYDVMGIPTITIINGEIVMKDGEILRSAGSGTLLRYN